MSSTLDQKAVPIAQNTRMWETGSSKLRPAGDTFI